MGVVVIPAGSGGGGVVLFALLYKKFMEVIKPYIPFIVPVLIFILFLFFFSFFSIFTPTGRGKLFKLMFLPFLALYLLFFGFELMFEKLALLPADTFFTAGMKVYSAGMPYFVMAVFRSAGNFLTKYQYERFVLYAHLTCILLSVGIMIISKWSVRTFIAVIFACASAPVAMLKYLKNLVLEFNQTGYFEEYAEILIVMAAFLAAAFVSFLLVIIIKPIILQKRQLKKNLDEFYKEKKEGISAL